MSSFKTRSTARKSVLTVIYTFIPLFALAFLGLKVAVATWLFFEIILLLVFGFCLLLTGKTHWEIQFKNDQVLVYNTGNRQSYIFEHLKQSDFHIKQSGKQKARNSCDMKLEDSIFVFYDVQSCQEMLVYIQKNFPN
jgi:hypothetical protein